MGCFKSIEWIMPPFCSICGRPLEFDLPEEPYCLSCQKKKRPYLKARSLFRYSEAGKPVILRLKHADGIDVLKPLAGRARRIYPSLFKETDLIVPIPLHYTRLVSRRYNQSALLCKALDAAKFNPFVLKRIKKTPSQGHMSRAARRKNVKGAFAVPGKYQSLAAGKRILLVDDVMTTGATIEEATKALLKAHAKSVEVFTLGVV